MYQVTAILHIESCGFIDGNQFYQIVKGISYDYFKTIPRTRDSRSFHRAKIILFKFRRCRETGSE